MGSARMERYLHVRAQGKPAGGAEKGCHINGAAYTEFDRISRHKHDRWRVLLDHAEEATVHSYWLNRSLLTLLMEALHGQSNVYRVRALHRNSELDGVIEDFTVLTPRVRSDLRASLTRGSKPDRRPGLADLRLGDWYTRSHDS